MAEEQKFPDSPVQKNITRNHESANIFAHETTGVERVPEEAEEADFTMN